MTIKIKKLNDNAIIPKKHERNDAAYDLYSIDNTILKTNQTIIVHTGISMEIKKGFYGKIESRSSLASRGIFVTGGIIDSGYRNEIMIILNNISSSNYEINYGDRVAQIIFHRVEPFEIIEVNELDRENNRGGGLGSSGK